jgi:hypothetical protein
MGSYSKIEAKGNINMLWNQIALGGELEKSSKGKQ